MTDKCYGVPVTEKYYSLRIEVNNESDFGRVHWTSPGKATHVYEGNILNNCLHGDGIYEWFEHGTKRVYEGNFYINNIEGYGRFSYPDGSLFQGLFRKNKKYGPGVHTQRDGNEDVGLWDGSNLLKIITCASSSVPSLALTPEGRVKLLGYRKLIEISEDSCDFAFVLKQLKEKIKNYETLYSDTMKTIKNLSSQRILYNEKLNEILGHFEKLEINVNLVKSDHEYLDGNEVEPQLTHLVAWNNSDNLIDILQFVFKYRQFEHLVSFRIDNLLKGRRNKFKPPGEHETKCYELLEACGFGDRKKVEEILENFQINPNVSDCSGNSGLVIASAKDAHVTIDVLLKYRANINHFNDEGLTPLSLCLLRYLAVKCKVKLWEKAFLPVLSKENLILEEYPSNGLWRQRKFSDDSLESFVPLMDEELECISNNEFTEGTTDNLESELNIKTSHNFEQSVSVLTEKKTDNSDNQNYSSKVEKRNIKKSSQVSEVSSEDAVSGKCVFHLNPILINVLEFSKRALELEKAKGNKHSSVKKTTLREDVEKEPSKPSKSKELKLSCIKKTILKLIRRGANPNITEVPIPSIFLAVFTEEPEIVLAILTVTENPSQKYPLPDGVITPLHIISMHPPSQEMIKICEMLLKFGADPNIKTEEEEDHSDEQVEEKDEGKTALQILCMRQEDNEVICEYQCTISKLLVKYGADTDLLYMDHSPLSLVMLQGKMKLFTTLLETRRVNPNQKLGNYGVPLTYLLSETMMAHIPIEQRMEMSELLLKYGADPLVDLHHMSDFEGNVIDFGMMQLHQMKSEKKKGADHFEMLLNPIIKVGTENIRQHLYGKIIKAILKANEKNGMDKYKSMLIAIPVSLKQGLYCIRMWALKKKKPISCGEISKVLNLLEIKEEKIKNILNKELKLLSNVRRHRREDDFETEQEMLKIDDFNQQAIKTYYSKPYLMPLLMIASDMIELACLPPVEAQDADGVLTYFHWLNVQKSGEIDFKEFEKGEIDFFSQKQSDTAENSSKKVKKCSIKDIFQQRKPSWIIVPETDTNENKYKACFQCGQRMKTLTECSSCKMIAFCSEKCMLAARDCNTHTCITNDFAVDKSLKKMKKGKGDESGRSKKVKTDESGRKGKGDKSGSKGKGDESGRKGKGDESGRSKKGTDKDGKKRDKSKKDKESKRKTKKGIGKSKRKKGKITSKDKIRKRAHGRKGKKKGMGAKKIQKKQKYPYKQKRFPKEYLKYFLMQVLRDGEFDINMFLLPYAVLRDGSLFYHVYGPQSLENYSYI